MKLLDAHPLHDTIEDGQNKKSHLLFSETYKSAIVEHIATKNHVIKAPLRCWKKGCLLLTKIKAYTVNTCFVCVCEILKILIGNMLNSMKDSPTFYPFSSCITS